MRGYSEFVFFEMLESHVKLLRKFNFFDLQKRLERQGNDSWAAQQRRPTIFGGANRPVRACTAPSVTKLAQE
jgi:hypothetical protein